MKLISAKTPAEYLRKVPMPHRATLKKLRADIRAAAPGATEAMYYQMPSFRVRVMLVCYAAFTNHCSLFLGRRVTQAHAALLKGYDVIPAGVRFPPDKPLPSKLVRTLVKARLMEEATRPKRSR